MIFLFILLDSILITTASINNTNEKLSMDYYQEYITELSTENGFIIKLVSEYDVDGEYIVELFKDNQTFIQSKKFNTNRIVHFENLELQQSYVYKIHLSGSNKTIADGYFLTKNNYIWKKRIIFTALTFLISLIILSFLIILTGAIILNMQNKIETSNSGIISNSLIYFHAKL